MAGHSSDEEENYWPGYVDALTTMTMVLTFIMMVLGVVVFTLAQNVSKTVVKAIAEAAHVDTSAMNEQNVDEFQKAVIAALNARTPDAPAPRAVGSTEEKPAPEPAPVASAASPPSANSEKTEGAEILESDRPDVATVVAKGGTVSAQSLGLQIRYRDSSIRLDDSDLVAVHRYLGAHVASIFTVESVVVQSRAVSSGGATEGRRRAYYRAMLIREQMVQKGVSPERISLKIRDASADVTADTVTIIAQSPEQP